MKRDYIHSMLGQNEHILLVTRQHAFVLTSTILAEIVVTLAVVILGTFAAIQNPLAALAYLLVFIPLGSMTHDILVWYNRQFIVTNRRVIQVSGVINKDVVDSSLEKVNDVKMSQSFFGRIFDYGDIEIMTASELGVNLFKRIGDPVRFKTAMLNAKEDMGYDDGDFAQKRAENIPALIAELDNLRAKGILTEAEFQQKKKELLAKL